MVHMDWNINREGGRGAMSAQEAMESGQKGLEASVEQMQMGRQPAQNC